MVWSRSNQRPRTLSAKEFASLPATLTVRVLRFHTQVKGFRSRTLMVATTLLDPVQYPLEQIAALYGDRWTVELRIRDVKTTLRMEVLRGKSPDVVRKEILMHFIAYDLIRALMWQAAQEHGRLLHRLSFAGTMEHFHAVAPYLCLFSGTAQAAPLYQLLLSWIASDVLPDRPNRVEPRALKRRPEPYDLLTRPRNEMRKLLLSLRVRQSHPPHEIRQVAISLGPQEQVPVVAHDAVAAQPHREHRRAVGQDLLERLEGSVLARDAQSSQAEDRPPPKRVPPEVTQGLASARHPPKSGEMLAIRHKSWHHYVLFRIQELWATDSAVKKELIT